MTGFSPIDAAIIALLGVAVWNGYRSGFIATAYGLATWIVAFAAAVVFQEPAAALIQKLGLLPATSRPVAFIVVILVVEGLFWLAGFFALTPVIRSIHRSEVAANVDHFAGVVPSALRSLFVVGIALAALVVSPIDVSIKAAIEQSRLSRALIEKVSVIQPQLASLSGQLSGQLPLFSTKVVGEGETEKLDFPKGLELTADPAAEQQLFELVNEERQAIGLAPLAWDERLVPVARQHSQEMFELGYFSHESPVTGSPFDRIHAAGIEYQKAGENLAYAQSVTVAHRGLMNSPGHRANILDPAYTRMGIGIVDAGPYGRMFTQLFLTPP